LYAYSGENTSVTASSGADWLSRFRPGEGPIYLGILQALEEAVREGDLQPGDQLAPQRAVAQRLGVDFTTVTRAYAAARARGLIEGAVGRGTFVSGRAADDDVGLVDLSMNLPPQPLGMSPAKLLRDTAAAILERTDFSTLMAYHPGAGSLAQRMAAATWIEPCAGPVPADRILVCAGAQTALAAILSTLTRPGDAVAVEALTYPGLRAAAAQLGLRLIACAADEQGLAPEALERACAAGARALYCIPTLHNPTTATMSIQRRADIARVVRVADLPVIEDDAYGRLPAAPLPALASFAPDQVYYLATLSKTLSPGLRTAFIAAPSAAAADRTAEALRSLSLMASPLLGAVATAWIRDGTAQAYLEGVRAEARARRAIAQAILPEARGAAESIHLWLDLPKDRDRRLLREAGRQKGLAIVTADAFAAAQAAPSGVRISLGATAKRAVLADALQSLAGLLSGPPGGAELVV
jgi:DNA-binding transcriptional MocR family regulator